jgi:isoleucyl-tRNA synthetase
MPFLSDWLWRRVVADVADGAPGSVHLAGWPEEGALDEALVAEVAEVRRVVELGRQARSASGLKLRQPLRRLVVQGAELARGHADELGEELRVKEVEFGEVEASELLVRPNLPVLGPRLGKELPALRAALAGGDFEELEGGRFRVAGHELEPDEVLVERRGREGWAVAADAAGAITVAIDTVVDPQLELEGRVLDLIHRLNSMRRDAGLELTDRIAVTLPADAAELLAYVDRIKEETLAVDVRTNGDLAEPQISKA